MKLYDIVYSKDADNRINYKKMAIIFAIYGPIVYIHRIIPANAISGL